MKQVRIGNFSLDTPALVQDVSSMRNVLFALFPIGAKKKNSNANVTVDDIFIVCNMLEDEHGEKVGITRMDIHLPIKEYPDSILKALDDARLPYAHTASYFGSSDGSIGNQIARKSLVYAKGSISTSGIPPKGNATTAWAVANAREHETAAWKYRAEKRQKAYAADLKRVEGQVAERDATIAALEQRVAALEAVEAQVAGAAEAEACSQTMSDIDGVKASNAELEKELAVLRARVAELDTPPPSSSSDDEMVHDLVQNSEYIAHLEQQLDAAKADLLATKAELDEAKAEAGRKRSRADDAPRADAAPHADTDLIARMDAMQQMLAAGLREAGAAGASSVLREKNDALEKDVEKLRGDLEQTRGQLQKVRGVNSDHEKKIRAMTNEDEKKTKALEKLRTDLNSTRTVLRTGTALWAQVFQLDLDSEDLYDRVAVLQNSFADTLRSVNSNAYLTANNDRVLPFSQTSIDEFMQENGL